MNHSREKNKKNSNKTQALGIGGVNTGVGESLRLDDVGGEGVKSWFLQDDVIYGRLLMPVKYFSSCMERV